MTLYRAQQWKSPRQGVYLYRSNTSNTKEKLVQSGTRFSEWRFSKLSGLVNILTRTGTISLWKSRWRDLVNDGLVNILSRHFHRNLTAGPRFQSPEMKGNHHYLLLLWQFMLWRNLCQSHAMLLHMLTIKAFDKGGCVSEQQKAKFRCNCLLNCSAVYEKSVSVLHWFGRMVQGTIHIRQSSIKYSSIY